eukprot:CAMPEP_0201567564 /NCGR_PEP_ID=MMETSP0190_2-20130828/8108_1 /ASSEMBLY_ACC=CAM_ASM_000263 /TAXON_ID=37353 /ORGANISM="Rosalina sp." /LENGTH=339 /DNA_ID=CAMNT_0047987699 /DNA_START=77 /DNA_END=1093 /DNA_ORIENTATION=-
MLLPNGVELQQQLPSAQGYPYPYPIQQRQRLPSLSSSYIACNSVIIDKMNEQQQRPSYIQSQGSMINTMNNNNYVNQQQAMINTMNHPPQQLQAQSEEQYLQSQRAMIHSMNGPSPSSNYLNEQQAMIQTMNHPQQRPNYIQSQGSMINTMNNQQQQQLQAQIAAQPSPPSNYLNQQQAMIQTMNQTQPNYIQSQQQMINTMNQNAPQRRNTMPPQNYMHAPWMSQAQQQGVYGQYGGPGPNYQYLQQAQIQQMQMQAQMAAVQQQVISTLHGPYVARSVEDELSKEDIDGLFEHYKANKGKFYQLCVNKWKLTGDSMEKLAHKFQKRMDEDSVTDNCV